MWHFSLITSRTFFFKYTNTFNTSISVNITELNRCRRTGMIQEIAQCKNKSNARHFFCSFLSPLTPKGIQIKKSTKPTQKNPGRTHGLEFSCAEMRSGVCEGLMIPPVMEKQAESVFIRVKPLC